MELGEHQIKAIEKLDNGKILCGGVGTGKSRTALAYYFTKVCGGTMPINGKGFWGDFKSPRDLFIITIAKKRDDLEWLGECAQFMLTDDPDKSYGHVKVIVDSWNNIKKYTKVVGAFFIFDEQRVCGNGAWVKAFLNITRKNKWILLSATPGDTWSDYVPVFIANGMYRNRTDFYNRHCVFSRFSKYPKIEKYIDTGTLIKNRNQIMVRMKYEKEAEQHHVTKMCAYDKRLYLRVFKDRWDIYDNQPIEECGKLCYLLRKVVNSDSSRLYEVGLLLQQHPKTIIFYNFTYELELLRDLLDSMDIPYSEWNGENHDKILDGDKWSYLVQYTAGCEGWNCITTNVIIFYSQNYSYRITIQAAGRIDRLNTPFKDLYYYHVKSSAPIDLAIARALSSKKNFNEKAFAGA